MITIGIFVILLSLGWGVVTLYAIAMDDGETPRGADFFKLFWPVYLGIAFGVLLIGEKWLP